MKHGHHEHRAQKHRYRAEDPHQEHRGEVERPQPQRPEVPTAYHRPLDIADGEVGVQRAHQIAGVDEVASRLYEGGEGGEEADEQRDVLDGGS